MAIKKTRQAKKKVAQKKTVHSIFVSLSRLEWLLLLLCAFIIGFELSILLRPKAELPQNEMSEMPADIRKELAEKRASHPLTKSVSIPILMYHYVEYVKDKRDVMRQALDTLPPVLGEQIATLKKNGYTFMTMAEVADVIDGLTPLPPKPVVLTFDDGYRDFYTDAFPILKKYRVKAVSYVVPGFTNQPNYMDEWQIKEIVKSGLVEIAAHTVHHVSLKGAFGPLAAAEIINSKKMLENEYHIQVVSFAYPYGAFDTQAESLVKKAQFKTAVSTIPGTEVNNDDRYFLFRLRPEAMVGKALISFLDKQTSNSALMRSGNALPTQPSS